MDTSPLQEVTDAFQALRDVALGLSPAPVDPQQLKASILVMHSIEQWARVQGATLLAEAEARQAWVGSGYRNSADWLAGTTKSNLGAAKRKRKLGSALKNSKQLKDAVDEGSVSPDTAEQIADTINEPPAGASEDALASLVDSCKGATPADARDAASLFNELYREETEDEAAERRHRSRSLSFMPGKDGMASFSGQAPVDMIDQIRKSVLHAAGSPEGDGRSLEQKMLDGLHHLAVAHAKGTLTGGRGAPQMLIVMSEATWRGASSEPAFTDLGTKIPAHEARRLAEIADLQRVVMAGSQVLDLGRVERYASDAQYRALIARDGCCSWGDCGVPGSWCDADHIEEWDAGGLTDLSNLRLLCPFHHQQRHRPGVVSRGTGEDWTITLADGTVVRRRPLREQGRTPSFAPDVGRSVQETLFGDTGRPPDRSRAAA